METLMSLGFEMQAFYFNAIEILGRPRRLESVKDVSFTAGWWLQ